MSFGENIDEIVEKSTNGLHSIHHTWERVRIGEVATLVNGFAFKSGGFNEKEGTPIVRIRDVTKGEPGTFYRGSVDDPKMTFVENGQIAIGMDGDFNCRIWNGGKALLNQRVCTLEADKAFYSQEFLAFALPGYLKLINDHTSSVTVKHLSSLTVRDIPLPLPPLAEQHRIVEKIETLFARLDKGEETLREVQKLLAQYRQSVLKTAVTGQLTADWRAENAHRLEHGRDLLARILQNRRETWDGRGKYKEPVGPDTTGLPELPEGWVWASVEQLAIVIGGLTKNKKRQDMPIRKPMLRVANVYQNRLELDDIHQTGVTEAECSRVLLQDYDLLVVEGNGSKDQIGRMAIWRNEIPDAVHQNHLIKVRMSEKDLVEFSLWWFQSPNGRKNIERIASSTSGLYTLSISKIESLAVPVPYFQEISEINDLVQEAFSKIDQLETWCQTELTRSAALRQSILKDAFSGRLVPQDPNDEPASELLARIRAERGAFANRVRNKMTKGHKLAHKRRGTFQ